LALVKAKRDEHIATMDKVDLRDQFKTCQMEKTFLLMSCQLGVLNTFVMALHAKINGNQYWQN
jgi:hypothetical protein